MDFGRVCTTVSIIFEEIACKISCTCFLIYFRNAVLDHLRISMIEKTGTPARYMAITAPERMDFVLISNRRVPSFVSPIATTPSRHKSAIISAVTLMIMFLCFTKRDWGVLVCSLVHHNFSCYRCPDLDGAQKLIRCPPLNAGVGLSVIFLSFKRNRNTVFQMKRDRAVVKGFAVSDECDIPEAQLLCLPLLCFWNFCILA